MPTALTPTEMLADIVALHKMLPRYADDKTITTEMKARIATLWERIGNKATTGCDAAFWGDRWYAYLGDFDADLNGDRYIPTIPVGYGATEIEAIETLLEMIGEDA